MRNCYYWLHINRPLQSVHDILNYMACKYSVHVNVNYMAYKYSVHVNVNYTAYKYSVHDIV